MLSNSQTTEYVKELVKGLQVYINALELEMKKVDPDYKVVSLNVGKMAKTYELIVYLTGVFTGQDLRVGGFRESEWAIKGKGEPIDGDK